MSDIQNKKIILPVDCIYEIIQYADIKTLHSCIALNQTFCQITIRILWSNPYKFTKNESRKGLIFRTYFSCLNDQEKKQVTTFLRKSASDFPKPFINYPSFLQDLETYELQKSMKTFLRQNYLSSPTENKINSIVNILNPFIGELFFNQNSLKYVNVYFDNFQSVEKYQIDICSLNSENLQQVLSKIDKFSFGFNYEFDVNHVGFLKFVQRNATALTNIISEHNKKIQHVRFLFTPCYLHENETHKLRKFNIEYDTLLEIFKTFILSLNNLKSLEMPCFSKNQNFENLFEKHSHSLTHLRLYLYNYSIVLKILDVCPNLETIELLDFSFFDSRTSDDTSFDNTKLTTNKLKNLYIVIPNDFSIFKLFERIVSMSNNNLKTLFYDKQHPFYDVISSIQPFCTNLTHLSIRIAKKDFPHTTSFLKSLQNLIHLKLNCERSFNNDVAELARSLPPSLQILEIDSIIIIKELKVLLYNLKCNLKEINIDTCIDDNILMIVVEYARQKNQRNPLMILRYSKYYAYYSRLSSRVLGEARSLLTVDDDQKPTRSFVKPIFSHSLQISQI